MAATAETAQVNGALEGKVAAVSNLNTDLEPANAINQAATKSAGVSLAGNLLYAQSGGPTAVINASAAGVIKASQANPNIKRVYAAYHGVAGLLKEQIFDLSKLDATNLECLLHTPGANLGSCRYKLADPAKDETDYARILELFKKYDIRFFLYNGGNDSMDTCHKLSDYLAEHAYPCQVIGIPKTIDNDLWGTDHSPGFGSAAKFIATMVAELAADASSYEQAQILVIEIMGRNAGWLTAAAALAGECGYAPDLIYLPEVTFSLEQFLADVQEKFAKKPHLVVAVSESVHLADGRFIPEVVGAVQTDVFGHKQMGGTAAVLAQYLKEKLHTKVRAIEFSLLQRCAAHCAAEVDLKEAYACGEAAVQAALAGHTGCMIGIKRLGNQPYRATTCLLDLKAVANTEQTLPLAWINDKHNGVTQAFIDYALPLTGACYDANVTDQDFAELERAGLPKFARIERKFI